MRLHDDRILIPPHKAWYSEAGNRDARIRGAEEVVRAWPGDHRAG